MGGLVPQPLRCSNVTWDKRDDLDYGEPAYHGNVGDLLWNPKMGAKGGHVLVAEVPCDTMHKGRRVNCGCGGWGSQQPCPSTTLVCECGEDSSYRDHHYVLLARQR